MTTTSVTVTFGLFAQALKRDATYVVGVDENQYSNIQDAHNGNTAEKPYITFEPNYWLLDGNYKFFPDDPAMARVGLMSSNMSDINGDFEDPPYIIVQFSEDQSTNGITLRFADASVGVLMTGTITFRDSLGVTIDEVAFTEAEEFSSSQDVAGFRSILIVFNNTGKGYRYLRLTAIEFGRLVVFTKADIKGASVLEQIDPLSMALPADSLELSLISSDAAFSIINPQGSYQDLQNNQPLDVTMTVDNEQFLVGTYYLSKWKNRSEQEISFTCVDAVGLLDTLPKYLGGLFTQKNVAELVDEIMVAAGQQYILDSSFASTTVTGYIPICSYRDALRHIAFAIKAYVTCSRSGAINIKPTVLASAVDTFDSEIPKSQQSLSDRDLELNPLVTGVELTAHQYSTTVQGVGSEAVVLYNAYLAPGEHTILFDEPMGSNLTLTGANKVTFNANYATVNVVNAGTVKLTGFRLKDAPVKYGIYTDDLDPSVKENVLKITTATLVSPSIGEDLAEHIYNYFQQRYRQKAKLYAPSVKVGDSVEFESLYDQNIGGVVESMQSDLTGGFVSKVEIVGVKL